MQLTNQDIEEYRATYRKVHGVAISAEQAREELPQLLLLCELVYQPITLEELSDVLGRQFELMPKENEQSTSD